MAAALQLAPAPTIAWDAPAPPCPDAQEVARRLAARLPDGIASPPARFVVRPTGGSWRVQATIGEAPMRELEVASCEEATEAAVVLVSIASTRERGEVESPEDPPEPPSTTPDATPEVRDAAPAVAPTPTAPARATPTGDASTRPAARDRTRPVRGRPSALLAATGGLGVAITEGAAGLVGAEVGLVGRAWSTTFGASHVIVREVEIEPRGGARFWLTALDVRGCGEPSTGRWQFPLCAGASFGAAGGQGIGLDGARRDRSPWIALRVGAAARFWPIPSVGVFVRAEPVFVAGRPRLVVEGLGTACCGANVGFAGVVGVVARLGRRGQRNSG
jgi:hypothetical protein